MKALSLFSGGLDSILAVKLITDQGIGVKGIFFETPFFNSRKAVISAGQIGLSLKVRDITKSHIKIVLNPRFGYGKHMNPCIDCHTLMLKSIGEMMKKEEADFIITGEVLGQRPMSQNLRSLSRITHNSGFKDLILRPLSAKRLPQTLPERKGWVNREKLLGLSGRSRKPQIELAEKYNVKDYPFPAGGCLLTDKIFSCRLRDLIFFNPDFLRRDIELLKLGRHFRAGEKTKIVVGRNRIENEKIASLTRQNDAIVTLEAVPGPLVIVTGDSSQGDIKIAADIASAYSDASAGQEVVAWLKKDSECGSLSFKAKEKGDFQHLMI